jgi:hypothetical protein
MMTELLRRAMEQAQQLPESEQDRLGAWLLTEMLNHIPVEEIDAVGLDALDELATQADTRDDATLRPLDVVLREYQQHGRFLGT